MATQHQTNNYGNGFPKLEYNVKSGSNNTEKSIRHEQSKSRSDPLSVSPRRDTGQRQGKTLRLEGQNGSPQHAGSRR